MQPFAAGGGVLWLPVLVDPLKATANCLGVGGRIKKPNVDDILSNRVKLGRGIAGWMATRQPPYSPEKMAALGLGDSLNVDVTETLRDALIAWDQGRGTGPQIIQVLWDCRFLLRFNLASMPQDLIQEITSVTPSLPTKIAIRWWTRYYLPKVVIVPPNGQIAWSETESKEVLLHSDIQANINPLLLQYKPKTPTPFMNKFKRKGKTIIGNTQLLESDWITSHWIRLLDPF